uniref:G-protein coupled receptors family 1 profile domain-containing protein n=1 Tax=Panagrolaimus sp. PS1159 TaxID=55785 RepID=A0AC35FSU0_9BILA
MAIADIISLVSICVHYVLSFGILEFNDHLHSNICKFVIFATHVSTSVSIWSWLLMSTLRYLSVYYPLVYISLWRLPLRVLSITFGGAFVTNLWLLSAVTYTKTEFGDNGEVLAAGGCVQIPLISAIPDLNRIFLFIEIFWSFVIPTITIIFVDSSVYLCRYSLIRRTRELESDLRKNNSCPIQKKTHRTLWKWLIIALIDVGLNTPENINRLAVILGIVSDSENSTESYLLIRVFSQLLYYLQFSFNGVYLALFIYDKSTTISSNNQSEKKRKRNRRNLRQPSMIAHSRTPDIHQKVRPSLASALPSPSDDDEEEQLSKKIPYHLIHKVGALKSPTKIIAFETV